MKHLKSPFLRFIYDDTCGDDTHSDVNSPRKS